MSTELLQRHYKALYDRGDFRTLEALEQATGIKRTVGPRHRYVDGVSDPPGIDGEVYLEEFEERLPGFRNRKFIMASLLDKSPSTRQEQVYRCNLLNMKKQQAKDKSLRVVPAFGVIENVGATRDEHPFHLGSQLNNTYFVDPSLSTDDVVAYFTERNDGDSTD